MSEVVSERLEWGRVEKYVYKVETVACLISC